MVGVDLTGIRKHNSNATHIALNQWCLHLLFYFLDVGTSNPLVLYIPSINNESINIAKFKLIRVFLSLS